ncbi:MAG: DNA polymerase III subunit chi [Rhodobacteraceae bacterium]|nr:DNA polymerase III subunit chi [Paracoccaceae bacterium]
MAEIFFYNMTGCLLESALPHILEKTLRRGWRALVRGTDAARLGRLDQMLWTRSDEDFMPHGLAGGDHDGAQPILLTPGLENTNGAELLVLIDGARAHVAEAGTFKRVCLMFDGNDAAHLNAAHEDWNAITAAGLPAKYWAQDGGRWVKKTESTGRRRTAPP